jgi:hypothetical protein
MSRVTWTSSNRGRTSPAKVEVFSRLVRTSLDRSRTSPDNPDWVKLNNQDLSRWVQKGPG